jgi:hypothetical protein
MSESPHANMTSTKAEPVTAANTAATYTPEIFPVDEEKQLLDSSNAEKATANKAFTSGEHSTAIQGYEKALKLSEWKEAVESATKALDALDRLDPPPAEEPGENGRGDTVGGVSEIDDTTEILLEALTRTGRGINDVHKLRTKALLRRAKARHQVGGWSSLQGALEDYQALSKPPHQLSGLDRTAVQAAMRVLPGELNQAKDREMAEMMGNLKKLGNGILRPFGLSTENFQFQQDPSTGGYSMNFNQNPGK